jgi:hypothetical protein
VLNPHVFRLVAHPGRAPELAARSGQGNWEPYALAAPADRLLPFVLTRAISASNSRWLNCASIVHADTEEVLFVLSPTGQTFTGPGPLDLVLSKVVDQQAGAEHFLYLGVLIPGLALPCGVPLRLLLDNAWQSPRFKAYPSLGGFQQLEWSHPGPLSGVPYGTGLVQRLYVDNGGLQYAAPREVKTSTQDAASGAIRLDYLAKYRTATTTAGTVPAYLSEALAAAELHASFSVDGEAWRVTGVKEAPAGTDGGRWIMTLSLEQKQVLQSRLSCPPAPLKTTPFDPEADRARSWHCNDSSDVESDYLPTGRSSCELDMGIRTGYLLQETSDRNPFSPSYGQLATIRTYNEEACPLPPLYRSAYYAESATKNDCAGTSTGSSVLFESAKGRFSSRESQLVADRQAIDYVQAGKQAYANANGICQASGTGGGSEYRPLYVESGAERGCFTCQMQSVTDPNDIREATPEEQMRYSVKYVHNGTITLCRICN